MDAGRRVGQREDFPCAHSYRRSISFLPHLPHLLLTMHFLCLLFCCLTFLSTLDGNLENGSPCASNLSAHHDKLHGWPRYIYFNRQPLPSILLDIFILLLSFLFLDTLKTVPEVVAFSKLIRVQLFKKKKKKC